MAKQPSQPSQTLPEDDVPAEVFSISQDKDGAWHLSRRDFLSLGMAAGGTLLLKGICPRFGANSTSTQPVQQAGMMPLPKVYLHTGPSIDSNIVDALQPNDIVLLIRDHADLGWVEVGTRAGQQGWLDRRFVDFPRAFTRGSRDFGVSGTQTPKPTPTAKPPGPHIQLRGKVIQAGKNSVAGQAQASGEVVQNGDFEAGLVSWVEESSHAIITSTWADPYQGSRVAWLGSVDDALDKLTQLFHVPADVDDAQTLEFYLKVTTEETSLDTPYDSFVVRFLDATGTPISADIWVADSTTPMDWSPKSVQLNGLSSCTDQDIQIQFEATTDSSNITNFVMDSVSLNLTSGSTIYVYLPIIVAAAASTPTPTATAVPCNCNSMPTCGCNSGTPCTCNSNPCSCDIAIPNCSCHGYNPCACDIAIPNCSCHGYNPCACDIAIPNCSCHGYNPCACDIAIPNCACHGYNPCTCNIAPCSCNVAPCICNIAPCSCNIAPCSCNVAPCLCNGFTPCSLT